MSSIVLLACLALPAMAQGGMGSASHKTLANGLEVFAVENRAVPLATICVVFRGGASAQSKDNAGLFHLYEHMLFASNEKYPNQAAFTAALNSMGVPSWNGATGDQYINYYITVPSDRLDDGVQFWSWAVRHPVFDAEKLETEKGVVLNEIKGYHVDPAQVYANALESRMFPTYPWRKNVDGPESTIQGASVADMKKMQATWYVPGNMALLVSGDIKADAVFAAAAKWFGDWKGSAPPAIGSPSQPPISGDIRVLYRDSGFYEGVFNVKLGWRGPDVLLDTKDTYTMDVLTFMMTSPVGRFKKALMDRAGDIYDPEYIDLGYPTSRDGGTIWFETYMRTGKPASDGAILDRAEELRKAVVEELAVVAKDPAAYFGDAELAKAKRKLVDNNLLAMENPASFVTGTLTFWWAVASSDYFYGYEDNCGKVGFDDIASLINRYILGKSPALSVRVSTKDAKKDPAMADRIAELKYEEITPANAFWWQR